MIKQKSLISLPAGMCKIPKRIIISTLLLLSVIPVFGEIIVDKQMTVKKGDNTANFAVPDPENVCKVKLTLLPATGWRIVRSNLDSSKLDSGNGWVPSGENSYLLTYDPNQPEEVYYTGKFEGDLVRVGGGGNGGSNGNTGETSKEQHFWATAELKSELKVAIGDIYNDSQTFKDTLTFRVGTDLSRVKAYFAGTMNQKGDLVTDASACSWSINGQPAGSGTSLSKATFPSAYKDTAGNIKAGAYNVQLDYKDPNTNVTSIVNKTLNLVGVKSLTVARGDAPDNTVTASTEGDIITVATTQAEDAIPTLYIPYTEDEAGDTTTSINLSAISSPLGVWPDDKPDFTLLDADGNTVDELAGLDGQDAPTDACTLPAPGTYTIKSECGNELVVKISVPPYVKILQVPEFLFASANYSTPIKFEIKGLASDSDLEITSITGTFHYNGKEIDLGDLTARTTVDHMANFDHQEGKLIANMDSIDRIFESYIQSSKYKDLRVSDNQVMCSAYFKLKVKVKIDGAENELEIESSNGVVSHFIDERIWAIDADNGVNHIVNDSRAIRIMEPKKETVVMERGDNDFTNTNPGAPLDGEQPEAQIGFSEGSLDVTFGPPCIFGIVDYKEKVKYRKYGLDMSSATLPYQALCGEVISEEIIRKYYEDIVDWVYPVDNTSETDHYVFDVLTNESNITTDNMSIEISVKEPAGTPLIGDGEFEIHNYGQRKDVVVYVSYGPKSVDNLGGEKAMWPDRSTAIVDLTIGSGSISSTASVTKDNPPSLNYTVDVAKTCYDITCEIVGYFNAEIGLVGKVFGSLGQIAAKIGANDNPPEPGKANTFVSIFSSLSNIDNQVAVTPSIIAWVDSSHPVPQGGTYPAHELRLLHVGEQLTMFVQMNANIRLRSTNTSTDTTGRTYTTGAEYNFGTQSSSNFKIAAMAGTP